MSKLSAKERIKDLLAGPQKKDDNYIIICMDEGQVPDIKSDHPIIVFRDFTKRNEKIKASC